MAGRTAFARSVELFTDKVGELRRQAMIDLARRQFSEAERQNTSILGYAPASEIIVDGRSGASIDSVKPGGVVVILFDVGAASLENATDDAAVLFAQIAPHLTGLYLRSLLTLVNGTQQDAAVAGHTIKLKPGDEVQITNLVPYARKLERGWSDQAPNGIFEVIAARLRQQYGKILNVGFSYEAFPGFEVGQARRGGALHSVKERTRASRYPTIRLSLK